MKFIIDCMPTDDNDIQYYLLAPELRLHFRMSS